MDYDIHESRVHALYLLCYCLPELFYKKIRIPWLYIFNKDWWYILIVKNPTQLSEYLLSLYQRIKKSQVIYLIMDLWNTKHRLFNNSITQLHIITWSVTLERALKWLSRISPHHCLWKGSFIAKGHFSIRDWSILQLTQSQGWRVMFVLINKNVYC